MTRSRATKPARWTRPSRLGGDALAAAGDLGRGRRRCGRRPTSGGEDVDDGEVEAEQGGELNQAEPAGALDDFAGDAGDADGSGEVEGLAAGDPGADAVADEHEGGDGLVPALGDGLGDAGAVAHDAGAGVADGDTGGALPHLDDGAGGWEARVEADCVVERVDADALFDGDAGDGVVGLGGVGAPTGQVEHPADFELFGFDAPGADHEERGHAEALGDLGDRITRLDDVGEGLRGEPGVHVEIESLGGCLAGEGVDGRCCARSWR